MVLARVAFVLLPTGFPLAIAGKLYWLHSNGWLWVQVPKGTEGAVYCESTSSYFIADADAARHFGFLFLT